MTHGIVAVPAQRIAARDPPHGHRAAAHQSVLGDRCARVFGAARLEPARGAVEGMDHGRQGRAIERNRANRQRPGRRLQSLDCDSWCHLRPAIRPPKFRVARLNSSLIAADSSVPAPARAITTTDECAGSIARMFVLKISRTRRFTRLRTTALPIRRETVTPSRVRAASLSRMPAYIT